MDGVVPEELSLPEIDAPPSTLYELASFIARAINEEERVTALAKDHLDRFYAEVGNEEEAASAVLSYIQSRHAWDVELLADKVEVEKLLYDEYSLYDEDIWEKVLNTEAISDLHYAVHKLSVDYLRDAINEVLDDTNED